MPRPKADIRIRIKLSGKPTRRIELIRQPSGQRYWVRVDVRPSRKLPEGTTLTEIADRLRRWIVSAR